MPKSPTRAGSAKTQRRGLDTYNLYASLSTASKLQRLLHQVCIPLVTPTHIDLRQTLTQAYILPIGAAPDQQTARVCSETIKHPGFAQERPHARSNTPHPLPLQPPKWWGFETKQNASGKESSIIPSTRHKQLVQITRNRGRHPR